MTFCVFSKLIELAARRAGVPVCNRPSLKPAFRNDSDKPTEGASFILPAGIRRDPGLYN